MTDPVSAPEYLLVLTEDELSDCISHYSAQDSWSFDVETMGDDRLDTAKNHVVWIALSSGSRTDVIPMGHPNGELLEIQYPLLKSGAERQAKGLEPRKSDYSVDIRKATRVWSDPPAQLDRKTVFAALEPLFAGPAVKVGHNLKFDINSVSKYLPAPPVGPFFDTMVAEWCLNSGNFGKLGLADCVSRTLGVTMVKGVGKEIEIHPLDEVADYAAIDAHLTYLLSEALSDKLDGKVAEVFDLEMQVLEVLAAMERNGVYVDQVLLKELDQEFADMVDEAQLRAWSHAGSQFNLNSVADRQRLLFGKKGDGGQGLRGKVLTPGGEKKAAEGMPTGPGDYSTSAPALKNYEDNDLVRALLDYAKFGKLRSTYTRPYLGGETTRLRAGKQVVEWVPPQVVQGRIHTRFGQARVETGRIASQSPNLQNVPSRTKEGKKIRDLFIASDGFVLVQADFSQIEPRIIADLSGDPTMLATYREGGDIYQTVADRLGVDRSIGKTLVLAIAYGIGPNSIAERNGMTKVAAKELMTFFRRQFPRIDRHKRTVLAATRSRSPIPYSESILGRRRYLPAIRAKDEQVASHAERQAYNHVIQGSASDVMKVALVRAARDLPGYGRMLLTVHDEVVIEVPESHTDEAVQIVKKSMETAGSRWLQVPLVADVKVAQRWGECK